QQLSLAADDAEPAFQGWPDGQSGVYLLEGHRPGAIFRLDRVHVERAERVLSQPCPGGLQHPSDLPVRSRVRASVRTKQEVGDQRRQRRNSWRLAAQWSIQRL